MKEISIIIPIYNVEKYVERGIESIINQTIFEKLEVILVDDGSKDSSLEKCQKYAQNYANINLYHKENGGVSSARNYGIHKAIGKYICFFDSDDTVEVNMYETLLELIENSRKDIAMIDYKIVFENGEKKKKRKSFCKEFSREEAIKTFFSGGIIGNNVFDKIFRKELVDNIQFYEGKAVGEDMYFVYQALQKSNGVLVDTSRSGYNYFKNESSTMNSSFSKKFFDTIYLSKLMVEDYEKGSIEYEYAYAHYIHEVCKVNEYMLLHHAKIEFQSEKKELRSCIKKYSNKKAKEYLTKRQFLGFLLMKYCEKLYLLAYKIIKVN